MVLGALPEELETNERWAALRALTAGAAKVGRLEERARVLAREIGHSRPSRRGRDVHGRAHECRENLLCGDQCCDEREIADRLREGVPIG